VGPLGARVCSKASAAGQWAAVALALCGPTLSGCSRHVHAPAQDAGAAPAAAGQAAPRQTPSGLPVPRYVSLKFAVVNARAGPGDDYPLKWIYRAKGLPLQVVAETEDWRRVCDSQGSLSWVHRRTTSDTLRTVIRADDADLPLHARAIDTSAETALLRAHAVADLKTCKGDWCKLAVGHVQGWVQADQVWGVQANALCRDS
jgi:SH3-like domain-containing protein